MTGSLELDADPTTAMEAVTKQYADALVVGLWDDRGNHNASGNTFPSSGGSGTAGAILKGDIWTISVAGTLGGTAVVAGDTVRALVDTPGTTVGNWAISKSNIGYTPLTDTLTSAHIFVGNSSNVATDVAMSGDVTIDNTGATTIGNTKVTNAMLAGSIAASKLLGTDIATVGTITAGTWQGTAVADSYIASASTWNAKLGSALTSANIFVGNGSNVATGVALSGDVTITNAGVATVANQWKLNGNTIGSSKTLGSNDATDWGLVRGGTEYVTLVSGGARFQNSASQAGTGALYYTQTTGRLVLTADNGSTSGGAAVNIFGTTGGTTLGTAYLDNSFVVAQYNGSFVHQSLLVANGGNVLLGTSTGVSPGAKLDILTFSSSNSNLGLRVKNSSAATLFSVAEAGLVTIAFADIGAATTSSASLRIRQAALASRPTTPNHGDFYHLDDNSFVFNTGASGAALAARLPGTFYIQVGTRPNINNTTTETTLIGTANTGSTITLPAGFLTVGKVISIYAQGSITNTGTPTLNILLRFGGISGTIVASTGASTMPSYATNHTWTLTINITCNSVGASGGVRGSGILMMNATAANLFIVDLVPSGGASTNTTIDTTDPQDISISAKWGTASSSNIIVCDQLIMQHL